VQQAELGCDFEFLRPQMRAKAPRLSVKIGGDAERTQMAAMPVARREEAVYPSQTPFGSFEDGNSSF
jgi:hypothetical protein